MSNETTETDRGDRIRYYKTLGGKRAVSVTTVLRCFKDADALVHWAWREGAEGRDYRLSRDRMGDVGKVAHHMIDTFIRTGIAQIPMLSGVPEEGQPSVLAQASVAFDAFRSWLDYTRITLIASEVGFVDDEHTFGGTLDAIGRSHTGDQVLLDWKSGGRIYPEAIAQAAAYAHLWEGGRLVRAFGADGVPDDTFDRGAIAGLHVLRIGREHGDFHHHYFPYNVLLTGKRAFFTALDLYRAKAELEKLVR